MRGVVLFCLFSLLSLLSLVHAKDYYYLEGPNGLDIEVNGQHYSIVVDGTTWFNGTSPGFHSNGVWYDVPSGNLKYVTSTPVKGTDGELGTYTGVDITWQGGSVEFHTIFQIFATAVVFNQYFPKGVPSTSINTNNDVLSSFPTLTNETSLYFFTYADWPTNPIIGSWLNGFPSSIQGGSPAIFYNNQLRSLLFSPLNNLMIGMQTKSNHFGGLAFGLNGYINEIPNNFTHRTLLVAGQGINNTFYEWGSTLLSYYGKERSRTDSDVLIEYLGYWTDNGAYYYYTTEPNKTYSQTMIDVYNYVTSINLPVKSYQFDSWWYFKGENDGVSLWEPMPSIFPEGMAYVDQNMGSKPLALHNRYFSPDNQYQKNFSFAIEQNYALPLDEDLFLYIMGKAKTWGMVLYEQDWLVTTYMNMQATQNNVSNARNWLLNMGNAADSLGLTIQYCMPLPLHIMQSVEIQPVTQSRVTGDYNPGTDQWQIGFPSIMYWSLGLFPFKDDFWTTNKEQTGCRYSTCVEPNPVLETLVAALSSGPVGPSDAIGYLNVDLIMHTCTKSGLLLKADKATTAIDSTFLPVAGYNFGSIIQVWDSFTQFGNNRWHYLLGAGLTAPFAVHTADLGLTNVNSVVFDYFLFENGSQSVALFDNEHDLVFSNQFKSLDIAEIEANVVPFNYYVIAPVLQSKWVFLGEVNKFITVSHQRISSIIDAPVALVVNLVGTSGETITISFYNTVSSSFSTLTPSFSSNTEIIITCTSECVVQ